MPLVNNARPIALESNTFTLAFTKQSFIDMLNNPKGKGFLEGMIDKVLRVDKGTYRVKGVLTDSASAAANHVVRSVEPAAPPPVLETQPLPEAPEASTELLDEVIAIFGGKIIEDE